MSMLTKILHSLAIKISFLRKPSFSLFWTANVTNTWKGTRGHVLLENFSGGRLKVQNPENLGLDLISAV